MNNIKTGCVTANFTTDAILHILLIHRNHFPISAKLKPDISQNRKHMTYTWLCINFQQSCQ